MGGSWLSLLLLMTSAKWVAAENVSEEARILVGETPVIEAALDNAPTGLPSSLAWSQVDGAALLLAQCSDLRCVVAAKEPGVVVMSVTASWSDTVKALATARLQVLPAAAARPIAVVHGPVDGVVAETIRFDASERHDRWAGRSPSPGTPAEACAPQRKRIRSSTSCSSSQGNRGLR